MSKEKHKDFVGIKNVEDAGKKVSQEVGDMLIGDKISAIDESLAESKKMIPTMRVSYFDGSYYTVRKDKPDWEYIIESLNRKKGAKFLLELTKEKQISTIENVDLVRCEDVEMTEEDYMKIPASPEIAKIQIELCGVTSIKQADREAKNRME